MSQSLRIESGSGGDSFGDGVDSQPVSPAVASPATASTPRGRGRVKFHHKSQAASEESEGGAHGRTVAAAGSMSLPPLPAQTGSGPQVQYVIALINGVNTWVPLAPEFYPAGLSSSDVPAVVAPVAPVMLPVPTATIAPGGMSEPRARVAGLQAIQTMLRVSATSHGLTVPGGPESPVADGAAPLPRSPRHPALSDAVGPANSASSHPSPVSPSRRAPSTARRSRTPTRYLRPDVEDGSTFDDRPPFDASFQLEKVVSQERLAREAKGAAWLAAQEECSHFSRREPRRKSVSSTALATDAAASTEADGTAAAALVEGAAAATQKVDRSGSRGRSRSAARSTPRASSIARYKRREEDAHTTSAATAAAAAPGAAADASSTAASTSSAADAAVADALASHPAVVRDEEEERARAARRLAATRARLALKDTKALTLDRETARRISVAGAAALAANAPNTPGAGSAARRSTSVSRLAPPRTSTETGDAASGSSPARGRSRASSDARSSLATADAERASPSRARLSFSGLSVSSTGRSRLSDAGTPSTPGATTMRTPEKKSSSSRPRSASVSRLRQPSVVEKTPTTPRSFAATSAGLTLPTKPFVASSVGAAQQRPRTGSVLVSGSATAAGSKTTVGTATASASALANVNAHAAAAAEVLRKKAEREKREKETKEAREQKKQAASAAPAATATTTPRSTKKAKPTKSPRASIAANATIPPPVALASTAASESTVDAVPQPTEPLLVAAVEQPPEPIVDAAPLIETEAPVLEAEVPVLVESVPPPSDPLPVVEPAIVQPDEVPADSPPKEATPPQAPVDLLDFFSPPPPPAATTEEVAPVAAEPEVVLFAEPDQPTAIETDDAAVEVNAPTPVQNDSIVAPASEPELESELEPEPSQAKITPAPISSPASPVLSAKQSPVLAGQVKSPSAPPPMPTGRPRASSISAVVTPVIMMSRKAREALAAKQLQELSSDADDNAHEETSDAQAKLQSSNEINVLEAEVETLTQPAEAEAAAPVSLPPSEEVEAPIVEADAAEVEVDAAAPDEAVESKPQPLEEAVVDDAAPEVQATETVVDSQSEIDAAAPLADQLEESSVTEETTESEAPIQAEAEVVAEPTVIGGEALIPETSPASSVSSDPLLNSSEPAVQPEAESTSPSTSADAAAAASSSSLVSAASLHAEKKPKFVGEWELMELGSVLASQASVEEPLYDHLIFRVDEASREDRAHPLGKVRLHAKCALVAQGRGALTDAWRDEWLRPDAAYHIVVMTQERAEDGTVSSRFLLVEWAGDEVSSDSLQPLQDLSSHVERALRKVLPLSVSLQASHPAQVTADVLSEDLFSNDDATPI